ncbi:YesL family protein [Gracilibacillus phocaeensis]|uniref:YesL family protein n=1 Tax=Gracilibacillus phocaeensis TaxID=2042304 RepID=UPI0010322600|nr:DUF624 domain-containing protein [Gracilibacillus phocaeensis]
METGMERLYYLAMAIIRLVYINLLVMVFTLLGLVLLGFFPALIACFAVIRKNMLYDQDIAITKNFFSEYKRYFVKGNLAGAFFVTVCLLLYVNFSIAQVIGNEWIQLSYYPILLVSILCLIVSIHIIPLSLHYRNNWKTTIKNACLVIFIKPINTIFLIASLVASYYIITVVPGLIPFFGVSGFGWIIMFFTLNKFKTLEAEHTSVSDSTITSI